LVSLQRTVTKVLGLLLSLDAASFTQLMPMSSLFREHSLDLETGVSQSWFPEYVTFCPIHCDSLTLNLNSSNDL